MYSEASLRLGFRSQRLRWRSGLRLLCPSTMPMAEAKSLVSFLFIPWEEKSPLFGNQKSQAKQLETRCWECGKAWRCALFPLPTLSPKHCFRSSARTSLRSPAKMFSSCGRDIKNYRVQFVLDRTSDMRYILNGFERLVGLALSMLKLCWSIKLLNHYHQIGNVQLDSIPQCQAPDHRVTHSPQAKGASSNENFATKRVCNQEFYEAQIHGTQNRTEFALATYWLRVPKAELHQLSALQHLMCFHAALTNAEKLNTARKPWFNIHSACLPGRTLASFSEASTSIYMDQSVQ